MNDFTPGRLLPGGIVCDHALPMYGDGEYRIPRTAPRVEDPDINVEPDEVLPTVDMAVAFGANWNRLRKL